MSPDGDSAGACLGFYYVLKEMGKLFVMAKAPAAIRAPNQETEDQHECLYGASVPVNCKGLARHRHADQGIRRRQ